MRNAFITVWVGMGFVSICSFTNNRLLSQSDDDELATTRPYLPDTVPAKKAAGKSKSKTVPYDSFGKPKKMYSLMFQ